MSEPERVKHTIAPPLVCSGCYWEERFTSLQKLHKKLQGELLRARGGKGRGRPERQPDRDEDEDSGTNGVIDLVDGLAKLE